ncbi:hypothetical protein H7H82_13930 [Mycobacterium heidelbergense]|uniref:Uncharacterized protein n=1 Tax=Mycobacterium heidelbergense TaxID=53376 RepID=A0A1X0DG76_MYCHE|nr:hypothetical protein [Mycobacterium heidelbergense]MCV7051680.1 hypothetical protein [Mycobacterium heidelbergense]ORA71404.1 hypothetical protein BST25_16890 [Mycobacterium heidelbergense]BBZ50336.1 hypothetical protein MHEI_20530 [Mycobacterium heidelbergense]
MARYKKMTPADASAPVPDEAPPEPTLEAASAFMQRAALTPLPEPGPDLQRRMAMLTAITIRHSDPEVAREAILQAAKVQCMTDFTCETTDKTSCAEVASQANFDPANFREESIDIRMRQLAADLGHDPARTPART